MELGNLRSISAASILKSLLEYAAPYLHVSLFLLCVSQPGRHHTVSEGLFNHAKSLSYSLGYTREQAKGR